MCLYTFVQSIHVGRCPSLSALPSFSIWSIVVEHLIDYWFKLLSLIPAAVSWASTQRSLVFPLFYKVHSLATSFGGSISFLLIVANSNYLYRCQSHRFTNSSPFLAPCAACWTEMQLSKDCFSLSQVIYYHSAVRRGAWNLETYDLTPPNHLGCRQKIANSNAHSPPPCWMHPVSSIQFWLYCPIWCSYYWCSFCGFSRLCCVCVSLSFSTLLIFRRRW